jgi:hypothetical protein
MFCDFFITLSLKKIENIPLKVRNKQNKFSVGILNVIGEMSRDPDPEVHPQIRIRTSRVPISRILNTASNYGTDSNR